MTTATPSIQRRADYGNGCYRRAIKLEGDPASVRGELVDDFHHFAVDLRVDAGHVQEITGEDIRVPWTTCPGVATEFASVVGGACHSFAKERVSQARKIPNTVRDFSDSSTASFDRE